MSVKIYPVTKTEPFCDDYCIKVNGTPVETNTARVSAIPFNRRWPGHQRDISQSEPIQFLSLAADEPLTFEITPKENFEKVAIRPASLGIEPEIGWYGEWGMAASSIDVDYAHLLMKKVRKTRDVEFCICQVSEWETNYKNGESVLEKYADARAFGADVVVFRAIENCSSKEFDPALFKRELEKLLAYLGNGKAQIILTTGFWRHPGDAMIEELSRERGYPLVRLGNLGEDGKMKAIGLFEHKGVANHPGDLGMQMIAERIFEVLKNCI